MGIRGRKAQGSPSLVRVDFERIRPPNKLPKPIEALFLEIVASLHPAHFVKSDAPLLVRYCEASLIAEDAASTEGAFKQWEASCKLQATLAQRLRLCPSARSRHETTARQAKRPIEAPPWANDQQARAQQVRGTPD